MKFKKKNAKKKWWLPVVVVIIIATTFVQFNFFMKQSNHLFSPIRTTVFKATNSVKGFFGTFSDVKEITKKNKELEVIIEKQKHLAFENKNLAKENKEFRSLLDLKDKSKYNFSVAEVSYIDSLNPYNTISINKGTNDGIEINMAVTSLKGLVGRVKKVFPTYSVVELITSEKSYTSTTDINSNNLAILNGQGNETLDLEYVVKNKEVNIGDKLYTSGVSDIYKKNLFIGTVESIDDSDEMFKQITVKLPYNIFNLKNVMILKKER